MMKKAFTYIGFALVSALIVIAFVTAKSYVQLVIAIILYPLLAYFALRLFPRRAEVMPTSVATVQPITPNYPPGPPAGSTPTEISNDNNNRVEVVDIDKRTFLKLIGTAGISFFLFSVLGRRVENVVFNRALDFGTGNSNLGMGDQVTASGGTVTDGYRISEIDDDIVSYYGFTNKDGAWLIMREDSESNAFRYARGKSNFSKNWADRENLDYDYYYNLF